MYFLNKKLYGVLVLVAMAMTAATSALGQSNYGALRGIVTDSQGASVTNATVAMTSDTTKIARTTATNGAGEYVFNAVTPGVYSIAVTMDGFKKSETSGIRVDSGNTVPFDVKLQMGSTSQSIEVSASEPLIDSGTSYNGQVIDSQKLQNLPNPGRNPFLFSKLDNNVTPVGDPRFVRFQDQSGSSTISIAGAPLSANNYLIDGVPITDTQNRAVIIPSIEAVDEVKVQSNTYDAEIGRTGGGNFNTTMRSGANTLHGVLQGETRQTNWGANTYFNNAANPQIPRGAAEFYSYVGAIGGPIVIPHIYNGRDRTFFWVAEEGYRQRSPLSNSYYVPTALERAGDFSQSNINIYDPTTAIVSGARTQFMGLKNGVPTANVIPTSRLNPVGVAIAAAYPLPNQTPSSSTFGANNFYGVDTLGDRADEFTSKVDHQVTRWWLANASYLHYGSKEPGGNLLGTFPGGSTSYLLYRKVDATQVNSTFTITPTTVATFGFGFNRFPNNTLDLSNGFNQATLGLPSAYASSLQKQSFPEITMKSAAQLGTANSGPAVFYSRNLVAGISKSLGKHSLKAGYVYRSMSVSVTNISNSNGVFAFDSSYTSATGANVSSSGADTASLVLGFPTSGSAVVTTRLYGVIPYNAVYLQDDYRITSKLTVNLGFRYENELGISERSNHTSVGFDSKAQNTVTGSAGSTIFTGGVEFAGQNGYPTHCCNVGSKFAPRGGFAYAVTNKTVVRGGFGVFYAPIAYSSSSLGTQSPGYLQTTSFVAPSSTTAYTGATAPLSNPYPTGLLSPSGNANGYSTGLGSSVSVIDQGRRAPIVDQYSADIQQELPYGLAFKLGYVGAHARNLANSENINQLPDNLLSMGSALGTSLANPYYNKGGVSTIGKATILQSQLLLPYPQFTTVTESVSNGYSQYNAMDVKLQKAFTHGLTVLAAYTWSSNWDNSWGASSTLNPNNTGPQDIYNLKSEYARAINDMPNRFTASVTYDLPFGKGKMFLSGSNRWMEMLVGGWTFNNILIMQSGSPLPVTQTNNNSLSGTFGIGGSVQRPNFVPGVKPCYSGSPEGRLGMAGQGLYINKAAFVDAPMGTYGNVPRTVNCYGPGYVNSDLSLNKTFTVTERVHAQFRAEALNAFNTPEFNGLASSSIDNASFGKITSTLGFPRLIQLGGRLFF